MSTYWMHRIKHEMPVSEHILIKEGYLTIGWHAYMKLGLLEIMRQDGKAGFDDFMKNQGNRNRNRWSLWRFLNLKKDDIVLVPIWEKIIICRVKNSTISVLDMTVSKTPFYNHWQKRDVSFSKSIGLHDSNNTSSVYDLGFAVEVEIIKIQPRNFATAALASRLKGRPTNADLSELKNDVDSFINASSPPSLYEKLSEDICKNILLAIGKIITPEKFERLVRWYMLKIGADRVKIPSKNECGKEDGADADVIAEFDDLKIIFYIQVKKHEGTTDDWAVQQIDKYKEQKQDKNDEYTYISWVISSAEDFSDDAKSLAASKGVRLINGGEFSKMLMNAGLKNIDDIFLP